MMVAGMKKSGFTLLEIVITMAILSIVMLVLATTLVTGQKVVNTGVSIITAVAAGERILNEMVDELTYAKIDPASPTWTSCTFQLPVEIGGEVIDAEGTINWGSQSVVDEKIEYSFVASAEPEHRFDEAANGIDINRDGDTADDFVLGRIYLVTYDDTMAELSSVAKTPPIIISTVPVGGDIDGDGDSMDDRMFTESFGRIHINIWVYCEDDDGRPLIRNVQTSFVPMN